MRDFKGMKRQRGRNRGGGGNQGGGGGGKPQHNVNRAFDSNGPDNIKIRGHAQHVYEKYQQLARDASSAGDRVLAENYLQHAEHYFRTLRAIQPNRAASEIVSRDSLTSGYDIDFEDTAAETAMEEADAQAAERAANPQTAPAPQANGGGYVPQGGEGDEGPQAQNTGGQGQGGQSQGGGQNQGGQQGQRRDRDDRFQNRGEGEFRRDREDRFQNRDRIVNNDPRQQPQNAQGGERQNGERQNGDFQARGDRPRYRDREDRYRDREPRAEGADRPQQQQDRPDREFRRDRERFERPDRAPETPRADPMPVIEPQGGGFSTPAPDEGAGVLRSQDGGVSAAPAFLQAATPAPAPATDGEAPARRPRARRKPAADAPATEEA